MLGLCNQSKNSKPCKWRAFQASSRRGTGEKLKSIEASIAERTPKKKATLRWLFLAAGGAQTPAPANKSLKVLLGRMTAASLSMSGL